MGLWQPCQKHFALNPNRSTCNNESSNVVVASKAPRIHHYSKSVGPYLALLCSSLPKMPTAKRNRSSGSQQELRKWVTYESSAG